MSRLGTTEAMFSHTFRLAAGGGPQGACRNGGKSMTHRAAMRLTRETRRVTRSGRTKVRSCSSALLQAMGPYLTRSGAKEAAKI